jgi:hypothetical protein
VDEDRSELVQRTLVRGLALLVGIAVVIAIGTLMLVKVLGLDQSTTSAGPTHSGAGPDNPLPSTALPQPHQKKSGNDSANFSDDGSANRRVSGRLRLSVTPLEVGPGQRINLTGTYGRHDNISLQVQRFEDGTWADFPTEASVSLGTFATFVETSRTGPNRFRVFDSERDVASNVVTVTVG